MNNEIKVEIPTNEEKEINNTSEIKNEETQTEDKKNYTDEILLNTDAIEIVRRVRLNKDGTKEIINGRENVIHVEIIDKNGNKREIYKGRLSTTKIIILLIALGLTSAVIGGVIAYICTSK